MGRTRATTVDPSHAPFSHTSANWASWQPPPPASQQTATMATAYQEPAVQPFFTGARTGQTTLILIQKGHCILGPGKGIQFFLVGNYFYKLGNLQTTIWHLL